MKTIYTSIFLSLFCCFATAQTSPLAHSLASGPYDFMGFEDNTGTDFPVSMQGWGGKVCVGTAQMPAPANYQATGDAPMQDVNADYLGVTIKNEGANGISFRGDTTGSGPIGVVIALDTRGVDSIKFTWIGEPIHAGVPSPSEMQCMYRIGNSGPWVNLEQYVPITYASTVTPQPQTFGPIVLPDSLENKPLVQIRWIVVLDAPARATSGRGMIREIHITAKVLSTPAPEAGFMVSKANPNVNEPITFTDQSTGGPTSWAWDFGDGNTSTLQNPLYAYAASGDYTVSLTVTNAGGTDSVVKQKAVSIAATTSNAVNVKLKNTTLYPNPASAEINLMSQGESRLKVFNRSGSLILSQNLVKGLNTLSVTTLPSGVYYYFYVVDKHTYSGYFQKQ